MKIVNETPIPAELLPTAEDEDRMSYLVVLAATFDLGADGRLTLSKEQPPPKRNDDPPYLGDCTKGRRVTSVCATGRAYAQKPGATTGAAALRVGDRTLKIAVFGPRVWQKALRSTTLLPSSPQPFEHVPMEWERAYGGLTEQDARLLRIDGEDAYLPPHLVGYPANFIGQGYYEDPERALDKPLPQLEHPEHLLAKLTDRPEPVCFAPYPMWGGLRSTFVMNGTNIELDRLHRLTSRAAPRATFEPLPPETPIALAGMRPQGKIIVFKAPPPPAHVEITIGETSTRYVPRIDAVDIDAEALRVRVVYRIEETYPFVPRQKRTVHLFSARSASALAPPR